MLNEEMVTHAGSVNRNRVHLLFLMPQQLSVSQAVQFMNRIVCALVAFGIFATEKVQGALISLVPGLPVVAKM